MSIYTDVMVDIETLGTAADSVILSIGAVAFNVGEPEGAWLTFDSGPISVRSSRALGFVLDEDTLAWWLAQSAEARVLLPRALNRSAASINKALTDFACWFPPDACLWGSGADFDNALLASAYDKVSLPRPWKYSNSRCYRTMKWVFAEVLQPEFRGVKHDALADALHQTQHLQAIFSYLKGAKQ